MDTSDLQAKYQKLAAEYAKVGALDSFMSFGGGRDSSFRQINASCHSPFSPGLRKYFAISRQNGDKEQF